jgi:hypothetical protein
MTMKCPPASEVEKSTGNEVTLLKSFNIYSLEEGLTTITQQQAIFIQQQEALVLEQKLFCEQMEKKMNEFQTEFREELRKIRSRQDMIKTQQEMIFTKQDQIQFTLHGETRPFQSPPTLSSPPFTSPSTSMAGFDTTAKASALESSLANASKYSSFVDSEEYSLFNLDWLTSLDSETKNSPQDPLLAGGPPQLTLAGSSRPSLLNTPQHSMLVGMPEHCFQAGNPPQSTAHVPQQSVLAGNPLHSTLAATPQHSVLAGNPPHSAHAATPQHSVLAGNPPHSALAATPQHSVLAGNPPHSALAATPQHAVQTTTQVSSSCATPSRAGPSKKKWQASGVDPARLLDRSIMYDVKDVGKLGRALASHVYFGESVLRVSTPCGDIKRGLVALDQAKLRNLVTDIHHHPSFACLSITDFEQLVKKKIFPSIAHLCKELRTRSKGGNVGLQ